MTVIAPENMINRTCIIEPLENGERGRVVCIVKNIEDNEMY